MSKKLLFIGDVFGKAGRKILTDRLPALRYNLEVDVCIANCENAANGRGVTQRTAGEMFDAGVDAFTSGNHLWDRGDSIEWLATEARIVKPANFPPPAVGARYYIHTFSDGKRLGIICLCGQVFMDVPFHPFYVCQDLVNELTPQTDWIMADLHAEATGEKRSFGHHFNGRLTAVVGTHTHVQTADEEILSGGTAYISDVGMTGPHDSVIGIKKQIIIEKSLSGMPKRFEPAETGVQINAVLIELDDDSRRALAIERIRLRYD